MCERESLCEGEAETEIETERHRDRDTEIVRYRKSEREIDMPCLPIRMELWSLVYLLKAAVPVD